MTGTRPSKGRKQEHPELLRAQGSREIAWSMCQPPWGISAEAGKGWQQRV